MNALAARLCRLTACRATILRSSAAAGSPSLAGLLPVFGRKPARVSAALSNPDSRSSSTFASSLPAGADGSAATITPSTDIAAAVSLACEQLGRPYPAAAVEALQLEWFGTAADLAALPDDTARGLGVPLRLKAAVADMLQGFEGQPGELSSGSGQVEAAADARSEGLQQQAQQQEGSSMEGQLVAALAPADGGAASPADWAALPIEDRRMPKASRFQNRFAEAPKLTKRRRLEPYALSPGQLTPALDAEFAAFHRFLTVRFFGAQASPIQDVTAAKYADHLRGLLGYLHNVRGVPLEQLSFAAMLPSAGRDGVSVLFDYILWLHRERSISVLTEGLVVRSAAAAAKFLYHAESRANPSLGERPYSDLEVLKELRAMSNAAKKQGKVAPRAADEEKKWLDWPEYLRVCAELRLECAGRDQHGRRRAPEAVAWSLQRFLLFSILSSVPDRQRTLRELEVGRTLVRDREGRWVIKHGPGDYKTGRSYGERPPLTIAPHIYPELEAFMDRWRAHLRPRHGLLFCQRNGEALTDKSLYKLFWTTAYRLTGKKTNPHLVRDSIVTYLRGGGATERELEALAIYMGHSVAMQRGTYDRRTKQEKVEPAVALLAQLNQRALNEPGLPAGQ